MSKREVYEKPKDGQIIKTKDGKEWTIDAVKEVYIKSDHTIETMALELQLPKSQLVRLARTGVESWNKLKKEYQERRLKILSERFDDSLIEKQSMVQRLEEITLMEMSLRIGEIEAHFKKWGDFFVRDAEDQIMKNGYGQAIKLQLPNSVKDLLTLKGLEDAKFTNARLLSERLNSLRKTVKSTKAEVIDVTEYGLFGDKNETD